MNCLTNGSFSIARISSAPGSHAAHSETTAAEHVKTTSLLLSAEQCRKIWRLRLSLTRVRVVHPRPRLLVLCIRQFLRTAATGDPLRLTPPTSSRRGGVRFLRRRFPPGVPRILPRSSTLSPSCRLSACPLYINLIEICGRSVVHSRRQFRFHLRNQRAFFNLSHRQRRLRRRFHRERNRLRLLGGFAHALFLSLSLCLLVVFERRQSLPF